MSHERRAAWFSQIADAALLAAGLSVVTAMVVRDRYPINAILLVAFCAGEVSANQIAGILRGWRSPPS